MNNTLKFGDSGQNVVLLQQYLNCKGFLIGIDGSYGNQTKSAVMSLQKELGLCVDGIADENMILNALKSTKIDIWALAIKSREGFIAPCAQYPHGTTSWANNNPGNLDWSGQPHAVQNGRFAKFRTYIDGYNALKNLLIRACTGQSKIYQPTMSLLQFFEIYSPSSDNNDPTSYATEVAGKLGVDINFIIKDLLNL